MLELPKKEAAGLVELLEVFIEAKINNMRQDSDCGDSLKLFDARDELIEYFTFEKDTD